MTYTNNFEDIYHNGYTSKNYSLLQTETLNQIDSTLSKGTNSLKLPPCHLNFGNFGNITFDWMKLEASPINYKLFNKLQELSNKIRQINQAFINLITELNCCGIAALYNDSVIPILKWVLTDFIDNLTNIASGLIQGNQAFKVLMCVVKPVPGNPWLKQGGMDWLNMIYSYLNGFEAVYNWIMDGNPVDMILNPVQDFYKKLSSCSPLYLDSSGTTIIDELSVGEERLAELLKSYEADAKKNKDDKSKKHLNTEIQDYNIYKDASLKYHREYNKLNNDLKYYASKKNMTDEESMQYSIIQDELKDTQKILENLPDYLAQHRKITNVESIKNAEKHFKNRERTQNSKITATLSTLSNNTIVKRTIDQSILDKFDPSCTCLTSILGLDAYRPRVYKTINTFSSIETLSNDVYWGDKDIWKSSIENINKGEAVNVNTLENMYITKDNIAKKYKKNNSKIDRDLLVTAEVTIKYGFLEDTTIDYSFINDAGNIKDVSNTDMIGGHYYTSPTKEIFIFGADQTNITRLYTDSGKTEHKVDNINTIFILNDNRQKEINRIQKLLSEIENDKLQIEYNFEKVWNKLRKKALDEMRFEKLKKWSDTYYDSNMDSITDVTNGVLTGSVNALKGTSLFAKLGDSFDIKKFLNFVAINHPAEVDTGNIFNWKLLSEKQGLITAAIERLEALIKIDNVVIEVVDSGLIECGCDILCKILQWLLDIIMSTVKALFEAIVAKILKMVMNEYVAYIIKVVLDLLQCGKDVEAFKDNIQKIRDKAKSLNNSNKRSLQKMKDPAYCDITDEIKTKNEKMKDDEIPLYTGVPNDNSNKPDPTTYPDLNKLDSTTYPDSITYPDPTFGQLSSKNTPESGNYIKNHGGTILNNNKNNKNNKNIPSMVLDCSKSPLPYMEISIEPRDTYEISLAFKPSDYILTADVIETSQGDLKNDVEVKDGEGNIIDTSATTNQISSLASIMDKAQAQIKSSLESPVYEDTDCSDISATPNTMKLCSIKNLWVESLYIIDGDGNKIEDFNNYGKISNVLSAGNNTKEYFPEDDEADENGMVFIKEGTDYWQYIIPSVDITVSDPIVETYVDNVSSDTDTTPYHHSDTTVKIEDYNILNILVVTIITYVDNNGQLEKHTTTSSTLTTTKPFRFPNLPLLGTFKNKVNHLSIRFMLDVLGAGEVATLSNYDETNRYPNVANLGSLDATKYTVYNISKRRLLFLSQKLLKDNGITSDPKAVAKETETTKSIDPNVCLLPDSENKKVNVNKAIAENLTSTLTKAEKDITNLATTVQDNNVQTTIPEKITLPVLKKSIPLIVLNKQENIIIQIVDRKIFLQFKSNGLVNVEPIIIDFELNPNDIYMLIFNINNFMLTMNLITPDKQIYTASGTNMSGKKLLPSIIGGNVDNTASFCGTIIDLILSKSGTFSNDYYNRSLMSYIPRTAKILFDFSVSSKSRVYNVISNNGSDFIKNTSILLNNFKAPISSAEQKSDYYGEIKSNAFYQVLDGGYMDNFFCRDNLKNTDFTVSLWIYKKINDTSFETSREVILSDDINENYIYYDAIKHLIYIDFKGCTSKSLFLHFDDWIHLTLSHILYENTYILRIQKLNGDVQLLSIMATSQFALMSICAEYNYKSKRYDNKFNSLLSTISIFLHNITADEYQLLHNEQKILVRGMEA